MSNNPVEQQIQNRLINEVKNNHTELLQFKNAQPLGADVLAVQRVPEDGYLLAGPLSLTAGDSGQFNINVTPAGETLTLWNFLYSITVDGANLANDLFPAGFSMTTEKRKLIHTHNIDWATSSDDVNTRRFMVRIYNQGTVSHDYYLFCRFYLPKLSGTA